ncbi:MAG: hypothetical protein ISP90_04835 [Nevskia sp.]|nr:hypothetical protein [Nevskia sp.]
MNLKLLLPLLAALPLLCAAAPLPFAAWRATAENVGPIRLGMDLDEVRKASGMEFVEQPDAGAAVNWELCHYAWPASGGQLRLDLAVVLHQGRVVRVEVVAPEIATASGARVGDSEARLRALYAGRLVADPAAQAGARAQLLLAGTRAQALRFVIDSGRVQSYQVGQAAQSMPGGGCA